MATPSGKCSNCGAPVEITADGRAERCPYCGAGGAHRIDPAALAASLRADARSTDQAFESLASTLEREFPDQTTVRRSGGLLGGSKVEELVVELEGTHYRMKRSGGRLAGERVEIVRGITLKTESLRAEAWIVALCESLADLANSSADARAALDRIARS